MLRIGGELKLQTNAILGLCETETQPTAVVSVGPGACSGTAPAPWASLDIPCFLSGHALRLALLCAFSLFPLAKRGGWGVYPVPR